jgi:hypothetical protein
MLEPNSLTKTFSAIRLASALTETTFLHVGQTLEGSIDILSGLRSCFETVINELKGENLRKSLNELAAAAARVAHLGHGQSEASARFGHLQRAGDAIAGHISKLNTSVKAVDALVVNSKIAATAIRSSEIDFTTFASDIAYTMQMTRTTLDNFESELRTLRKCVGSALAGQLAFEKRQDEATRSIPGRLNATVNSIPLQHERAARAISTVRQRSEHVREQVSAAIMALQAGDITRQRLEHTDAALRLLTEVTGSSAGMRSREASGHPVLVGEDEQRALADVACRLQSAQLADAAEEFARDVRQITTSLNGLAAEAATLRTLAASAYGSAGRDHGTFIVELEAQVGEALSLFADFGTSQAKAANVMASISDAAESLCAHLRTVQSLEADIRILGLNTTLKCGRVGPEGRALGHIAQELRAYGNDFAREAGALMAEVESLAQFTRSIGTNQADAASFTAAVMQAMKDALATLRQVGQTLGSTLSALERDSDRVVILLEQTAANVAGYEEIDKAMRQAVNLLSEVAPPGDTRLGALTQRVEQVLDLMARDYTMANERVIHDRVLGRTSSAVPAKPMASQPELEDILF